MHILFVLHDLSLTGAPKLGLQIAEAFARQVKVTLLARQDGNLRQHIHTAAFKEVVIDDAFHEDVTEARETRVSLGLDLVRRVNPDLIYVNSLAAAEWISIARISQRPNVLHVHEMKQGMLALERNDLFNPYDVANCDYAVYASEECQRDFMESFAYPLERGLQFGVAVDIQSIRRQAKKTPSELVNVHGLKLENNKSTVARRKRIAMCGTAVPRKGCDIFWHLAERMPWSDFLWIGSWDDDDFVLQHNAALSLNKKKPLANLYWTNTVHNPYAGIQLADLFTLTSREDPNPLVVLEALALGVPVVAFTQTGGSKAFTSRYGYTLCGAIDTDRLANFCQRYFEGEPAQAPLPESLSGSIDVWIKSRELLDNLKRALSHREVVLQDRPL